MRRHGTSLLLAAMLWGGAVVAAPERYALTVKVDSVVGVAALKGAVAKGYANLDTDSRTLWGSVTQLVVGGRTYNLKKPASLAPTPYTIDAAGKLRLRITTPDIDVGVVGQTLVSASDIETNALHKGISLVIGVRITGGPAKMFATEIIGRGQAVYTGPPSGGVGPIVAPSIPWQDRLKRQFVLVSAPDYFWPNLSAAERERWLNAVAASGVDGLGFELGGPEGAINYIKGQNPQPDYDKRERELFRAFEPWIEGIRARGLIASVKFWNANGNASGRSASWWKDHSKAFVKRFGSDNIIALPGNERDSATSDDRRKAIYLGFIEAGFPKSQLIGYDSKREYGHDLGYVETHPQKSNMSDMKGSDRTHINCGDSRPAISYRYSDWLKLDGVGGQPKPKEIEDAASRAKKRGTSYIDYGFRQVPDYVGLAAVAKGWGLSPGTLPPPVPQPGTGDAIDISRLDILQNKHKVNLAAIPITKTLTRATIANGHVDTAPGISGWGGSYGEKLARGHIYWMDGGKLVGGHFDWYKDNQTHKTLKNIPEGYLGRKPPKGATVYFCMVSNDARQRTNLVRCETPYP